MACPLSVPGTAVYPLRPYRVPHGQLGQGDPRQALAEALIDWILLVHILSSDANHRCSMVVRCRWQERQYILSDHTMYRMSNSGKATKQAVSLLATPVRVRPSREAQRPTFEVHTSLYEGS
jgi:hypothetical protein